MKKSSVLRRFGVSMGDELLDEFDKLITRKGYATRSEAISDLVRHALAEDVLADDKAEAIASVSLVYNHHVRNLTAKLTETQHKALDLITSALHVHMDADNCLEVLVVRGPLGQVRELANNLISIKGVKYGKFVTTTGVPASKKSRTHSHTHNKRAKTTGPDHQ
jgi:CopG family nickel-responsive transcriptional regulator